MNEKSKTFLVFVFAVGISITSVWFTSGDVVLSKNAAGETDAASKLASIGASLLVCAILIERAIELLVGAQREKEAAISGIEKTESFRQETRVRAMRIGLLLGVILAFVGVRTLTQIFQIDPGSSDGADPKVIAKSLQFKVLTVLDVFLTGVLISGGSSGIHDLLSFVGKALKPQSPDNKEEKFSG